MRSKRTLVIFWLGVILLIVGCAPKPRWNPTQPSPRPMLKRHVSSVEVFTEEAPKRPHLQVGTITGERRRVATRDARGKLMDDLLKHAAATGCDAVVMKDLSQPEIPGSKRQPPVYLEAACLMWTEDAPAASEEEEEEAGCTNDMQCKGDRICENSICVDPPPPPEPEPVNVASGTPCAKDSECPESEVCVEQKCAFPPAD